MPICWKSRWMIEPRGGYYKSIISTIEASKDFRRAVLIGLLVRFLKQRGILVELSNREAKIETAQFDGVV